MTQKNFKVNNGLTTPNTIFEYTDGNVANTRQVTIQPNSNTTANYSLTLPVDNGTVGQSLVTDGNGNLSFASGTLNAVTSPVLAGILLSDRASNRNDIPVSTVGATGNIANLFFDGQYVKFQTRSNVDTYTVINVAPNPSNVAEGFITISPNTIGAITAGYNIFTQETSPVGTILVGNNMSAAISGSNLTLDSLTSSTLANGNSNVSIPTANGNVTIAAGGNTAWNFDTTGRLTVQGDILGKGYNNPTFLQPNYNDSNYSFGSYHDNASDFWMQVQFWGDLSNTRGFRVWDKSNGGGVGKSLFQVDGGGTVTFNKDATITDSGFYAGNGQNAVLGQFDGNTQVYTQQSGIGLQTYDGANFFTWGFSNTGNMTLPGNTFAINYANGNQVSLVGNSLVNGSSNVVVAANGNVTIGAWGVANQVVVGEIFVSIANMANFDADSGAIKALGTYNMELQNPDGSALIRIPANAAATPFVIQANSQNMNVAANSNIYIDSNTSTQFRIDGNNTLSLSNTSANITGTANVTGNLITGDRVLGNNSYDKPRFIQPNGNDANWSYGIYTDGASNFWMQAQFYGQNQSARGFRVFESEGSNVVFQVDGTGKANISGNLTTANISSNIANLTTANVTGETIVGGNANITGNVNVSGNTSALNGLFRNGESAPAGLTNYQLAFGYQNSSSYRQFIHTTHNDGSSVNNTIDFYTSDGNINGTLANAILGLTVTNGEIISPKANITGNANIGNIGTSTAIITTGNITTINTGLVRNGNSNITIVSNGNVVLNSNGTEIMAITGTGANITGTGNFSGNLNAPNFIGRFANGNSNISINANGNVGISVTGTSNVITVTGTGANITGTANASGNISSNSSIQSFFNNVGTGNTAAFMAAGSNTTGGTGYYDFLFANNTANSTTGRKTFRLDSNGTFEIINSAYTSGLLGLSDTGNLSILGAYSVAGKQAVNGPAFSAYANATLQTITSGSQQKVLFQTEEYDTNNNYASSRFTPTVEGYYQLNAEVRLDGASGTGEFMIILYKNGSEYKRGTNQSGTQVASNFWAMQVSSLAYANGSTDYFEIYVQQGSGSSVTVTAVNNPAITWFNGCMVRGA